MVTSAPSRTSLLVRVTDCGSGTVNGYNIILIIALESSFLFWSTPGSDDAVTVALSYTTFQDLEKKIRLRGGWYLNW